MTLASLTSCGNNKEITCQDVIDVYEEAGYSVFHCEYNPGNTELMCYVKCTATDTKDDTYFNFFVSKDAAEEYSSEQLSLLISRILIGKIYPIEAQINIVMKQLLSFNYQ